jgi:hypothetical protein
MQRLQLLQGFPHDAYKSTAKLREPTRCPRCHAVYRGGRWTWGESQAGAEEALCPACHRIRDSYPAGFVHLSGAFFAAHRDEILHRVANVEAREKSEHPLERIMAIAPSGETTLVTTTSVHLARSIGEALEDAWKGALDYHYNLEENLLRVTWQR